MILMIRNASFKCTSVINVFFDESDTECSAGLFVYEHVFFSRGDKRLV